VPDYILDPCVEEELWAIWTHIARDNPVAATAVVEAAFATFRILAQNPRIGTMRKFRDPRLRGIRSVQVTGYRNYLIFYRSVSGEVQVHHVYHGARDLDALFDEK
jgi:toxin ParE1/3/4